MRIDGGFVKGRNRKGNILQAFGTALGRHDDVAAQIGLRGGLFGGGIVLGGCGGVLCQRGRGVHHGNCRRGGKRAKPEHLQILSHV